MSLLQFMLSRKVISMIVRDEDSLESLASSLDELVVFRDIEERIHQEALIAGFDVVAVNGKAASEELLDVEALALVAGLEHVLVGEGRHREEVLEAAEVIRVGRPA